MPAILIRGNGPLRQLFIDVFTGVQSHDLPR